MRGERDGLAVGFGAEDAVLLEPVSTQREVTRVPSSFWKVSMVSTWRSYDEKVIEELFHPVFGVVFASDFLAACLDDDIVARHELTPRSTASGS